MLQLHIVCLSLRRNSSSDVGMLFQEQRHALEVFVMDGPVKHVEAFFSRGVRICALLDQILDLAWSTSTVLTQLAD